MNTFLTSVKNTYQNVSCKPNFYKCVKVVLGNESCDLDSAISALVYGFVLHHQDKQEDGTAVLPLLNIPKDDLALKTEVTYFLKKCGIDLDLIPTRGSREDLLLQKIKEAGCLKLILVDHHNLSPGDEDLESSVVEVIDHRPQDQRWQWRNVANVTLESVGSCCTLVADKIYKKSPDLLTPEISRLLLGPILVDTVNLEESAGRALPLDKSIVALLEDKVAVDRGQLYHDLLHAKSDIGHLSTAQVFKKDLKVVSGIPILGAPLFISDLCKRSDFESVLNDFKETPVIILMGVKATDNSIARDLAVFIRDDNVGAKILQSFLNSCNPNFDLKEMSNHNIKSLRLFSQGNVKATRKQIAPIVGEVMSKINSSP